MTVNPSPRKAATAGAQRSSYGKTTVQETYRWPRGDKTPAKYINLNTQPSKVGSVAFFDKAIKYDETTYSRDYIQPRFSARCVSPAFLLQEKKTDRDVKNWRTTYDDMQRPLTLALKGHKIERVPLLRPIDTEPRNSFFEGATEYHEVFTPKKVSVELYIPVAQRMPTYPFRGTSTSRKDYNAKPIIPIPSPPPSQGRLTPETRDFQTTYGASHRKLPAPELSSSPTFMRHWNYKRRFIATQ